jgi:hypothetical protein
LAPFPTRAELHEISYVLFPYCVPLPSSSNETLLHPLSALLTFIFLRVSDYLLFLTILVDVLRAIAPVRLIPISLPYFLRPADSFTEKLEAIFYQPTSIWAH